MESVQLREDEIKQVEEYCKGNWNVLLFRMLRHWSKSLWLVGVLK